MERAAFEAWWRRQAGTHYPLVDWFSQDADGKYLNIGVYFAWHAWQARALWPDENRFSGGSLHKKPNG